MYAKPLTTCLETCPDDAALAALLDDSCPSERQRELVDHLDRCASCRDRLEAVAGSTEFWSRASQHLRDGERADESRHLADTLRGLLHPTKSTRRDTRPSDVVERVESADVLPVGHRIGSYVLGNVLGRGGMGVVYRAHDEKLDREVALKAIRSNSADDPETLERSRRESRAVAAIRHENVVAIHHVEESGSGPFLVMELVDGESLDERLRRGPSEWSDVARTGAEIAAGLAAAHERGVVHRDVKPGNVLLETGTGRVKLTDFGLARSLGDGRITREDHLAGTPEFISPEQADGRPSGPRGDLFSLGSVMYAMCTGFPPFRAENPLAVLLRTRDEEAAPITATRPDVPAELVAVIERLMRKNPADRFASAAEVAERLSAIASSEPAETRTRTTRKTAKPGRRRTLVAAVALLVGLFAVSEVAGLTSAVRSTAHGLGLVPVDEAADTDEADAALAVAQADPKKPGRKKRKPVEADDAPTRVQIVSPEALLRDRIQKEKDELELPPSPHLVRTFTGHTGPVNSFDFTPDGESLISASGWPVGDRTLRQWNVETGKQTRQYDVSGVPRNPGFSGAREAPGEFQAVVVTPDGKHAVTTGTGGAVCIWRLATGELLRTFDAHTATVYAVDVSSDGRRVLTAGRDQIARLWDFATGEELVQMPKHRSFVRAVAISPDGTRAVTGGLDKTLRLWDLQAAELVSEMAGDGWITSAEFSPDGRRVAVSCGPFVDVWDLESEKRVRRLKGHGSPVTCVAYSSDGSRLLSCGYDHTVRLWDAGTGKLVETFRGHRDWVWHVAFSPDGRHAVSSGGGRVSSVNGTEAGVDFDLRLWKLPAPKPRVIGAR